MNLKPACKSTCRGRELPQGTRRGEEEATPPLHPPHIPPEKEDLQKLILSSKFFNKKCKRIFHENS
jgi:hypothetical protein